MARVLGRQLDILGSSLPQLHSFPQLLSFSAHPIFFAELALQTSPNQILVHLFAFPPLKLLVIFIFCSTAIFNSTPEASFYSFVLDLECCNVLPF